MEKYINQIFDLLHETKKLELNCITLQKVTHSFNVFSCTGEKGTITFEAETCLESPR